MTCSTPPPMCGAITAPGGVSTTQGDDPSIVKYTAPVSRIARSTSDSVSKDADYPSRRGRSGGPDGPALALGRVREGEPDGRLHRLTVLLGGIEMQAVSRTDRGLVGLAPRALDDLGVANESVRADLQAQDDDQDRSGGGVGRLVRRPCF